MHVDWWSSDGWCLEEITMEGPSKGGGSGGKLVWEADEQWRRGRIATDKGYFHEARNGHRCLNVDMDANNQLIVKGQGWTIDYSKTTYRNRVDRGKKNYFRTFENEW